MKKIIRVFPRRTSYTPDDDLVFIGPPPKKLPEHEEIDISCVFTWDKDYCESLNVDWQAKTDKPVLVGGVAYESLCNIFVPGRFVKTGVTFTSRGCLNNCPWCLVPKREGKLRTLPITEGHIIQDNNFLQCNKAHKAQVIEMLKGQKNICFKGGLQSDLLSSWIIEKLRGLRIKELWLACDTDGSLRNLEKAVQRLKHGGFKNYQLKCYALIGSDGIEKDEARLMQIYEMGCTPFAQLYRNESDSITYSKEYKQFARIWCRPPLTGARMRERYANRT